MDFSQTFDKSIERIANTERRTTRGKKIHLYASGVKAKLTQAEFALYQLEQLANCADNQLSSTSPEPYRVRDKVHFYCDSFWTFLYSSLDVLAQLINQAKSFNINEKEVSFKRICKYINENQPGTPLQRALAVCVRSRAFKNLEDYRHCSTHRRQIFIREEITQVTGTEGYSATASLPGTTIIRLICDNPTDVKPRVKQARRIPEYMQKNISSVRNNIDTIVRSL